MTSLPMDNVAFKLVVALACVLSLATGRASVAQSDASRPERAAAESEEGTFHVLFLAADAPLWLQLQLSGSRDGIHLVRQRYVRLLIQSVDADNDGLANPAEAAELPLNGRPSADGERLGERWTEFDTLAPYGRLSPEEYLEAIDERIGPEFLTRRKPPLLAQSVQLLPRLDLDGDDRISQSEILSGTQTLTSFDFDDDGTFSPAELQPFPQAMVDSAMAGDESVGGQPFLLFDKTADPAELASLLTQKYATDMGIPPERSGVSEFAFQEMDRDADGWLNESEAIALVRPRPVAHIGIDLFAGRVSLDQPQRGGRRVKLLPVESPRRIALQLGAEVVEFSARDNRYAASDQINLLKIRFLRGDVDKNGYMGPEEFVTLTGLDAPFEEVDGDGDGKVFMDELDQFIRIDSYLAQCAVEMEFETVEKPLFRILDTNLDRRLTAREFADSTHRLQEFDVDADGILDAQELDLLRRFRVKFAFVVPPAVRPERSSAMMANRRMPVANRVSQTGPEWFQKMDRNQDGDLTWREFLGSRAAFDRLDADGNGWIDDTEAAASVPSENRQTQEDVE